MYICKMHVYIRAQANVCVNKYIYRYVCTYACLYICFYAFMYMCACMHMRV